LSRPPSGITVTSRATVARHRTGPAYAEGETDAGRKSAMGTSRADRPRNEATASIPHNASMSRVLATPAPTVCAACESVPVVILVPPASAYHLTIAGPGMLVFGA
jgi:hypothetical protein